MALPSGSRPVIIEAYERHRGRATFIGVCMPWSRLKAADVNTAAKSLGFDFRHILDDGRLAKEFGVIGTPSVIVGGRTVQDAWSGAIPESADRLAAAIEAGIEGERASA